MIRESNRYDVVIIGGGPAGSTAGYLMAKAGRKVLIIDKGTFPRHKLCAGCITAKTIRLLERVFGVTVSELKDRGVIDFESGRYEVYCGNRPIVKRETHAPFYFVHRYLYDDLFLKKARKEGAEVREGERVVSIDIRSRQVRTDSGAAFSASFIIGADGMNSIARRQFPGETFDRRTWRENTAAALEMFIDRSRLPQPVNHPILFFDYLAHGYAWMFPNSDRMVLGICGLASKNSERLPDAFSRFLSDIGLNSEPGAAIKGYSLPFGSFLTDPVYENILLTGDAAGFADPLIGEGIFYAHRSAELAAQAICGPGTTDNNMAGRRYIEFLRHHIYDELTYAGKIRDTIFTHLNSFRCLPLKVVMNLLGDMTTEAIHGIRSYRWMKKLDPADH